MSVNRFIDAHNDHYDCALREIKQGCKVSHWMWFIFPQVKGLEHSSMSEYFGIENIDEAKEYINNPYLREHMIEICSALLALDETEPIVIFGGTDAAKLKSSMTLFEVADPSNPIFTEVIHKFYGNSRCCRTLNLLAK